MNIIKDSISMNLQTTLNEILEENIKHFKTDTKLFNHKLLYCNKWKENKYEYLIDMLKSESEHLNKTFKENTLIQINIINAPPDCNNQLFHIDYNGDSISYFIPFVELNDMNGTEYLHFYDTKNYLIYYDILLHLSDLYLDKHETILYLKIHNLIYNINYTFKCANSTSYGLIEMPNYVLHRGQKNRTNYNRFMLNILFSINNKYNYPVDEIITDSEADQLERLDTIYKKRNNIIF